MSYLYGNMLDPDLYASTSVARFIENLCEPEIENASDVNLAKISRDMMPMDDINTIAQTLAQKAEETIKSTGTLNPHFIAFKNAQRSVKLDTVIPQTPEQIKDFLAAGKALAFIQASQCLFFSTMQPIANSKPVSGNTITEIDQWGYIVIGSSWRGNCFIVVSTMDSSEGQITFNLEARKITRDRGKYPYPYSQFFHIEDEEEMGRIISKIPKIMSMSQSLSEKECVINFATTLKGLKKLGYNA